MDPALIQRIVEAALLASSQPLTVAQLQSLFGSDDPLPNGAIETALETLRESCAGRGVELVEVASGFRFQVCTDVHPWVARLWAERPQRYTRATLETLALIAYRQPITRGEIEQIRGVAVNSNIIKMLEEREWIRVIGHRDVPGRPALFGTTKLFLDYFNLKSLDELPPLSELRDLTDLEPQLPLDTELPPQAHASLAMPDQDDADSGNTDSDNADSDNSNPNTPDQHGNDNDDTRPENSLPDSSAAIEADPLPHTEAAARANAEPGNEADADSETAPITTAASALPDAADSPSSSPLDADDNTAPEHTA